MDINQYLNATPMTSDGEMLGEIAELFLDNASNEPTFAVVKFGPLNQKVAVVPLNDAELSGATLALSVDKQKIESAPLPSALTHLSAAEEDEIYKHYFG